MVQSLQHLLPVSTKKKKKKWPTPGVDHGLWLAPHHVLICTLVFWLPPGGQSLKSKSIKKLCLLSLLLKLYLFQIQLFLPELLQALISFNHFSVPFLLSCDTALLL